MPKEPVVSAVDRTYRSGTVGLAVRPGDNGPQRSLVTFRFFQASSTMTLDAFLRGDCNDDGTVNISDATCILNWLFAGEATPECVAATNTNGDGVTNITDATYLLGHLFSGGPAPAQPYPDCGPGMLPADPVLGCANPPDCQ